MSKNPLIKYYEVLNDAKIYELDDMRRVALPARGSKGKVWKVGKGQYVKSFGQIGRYKTPEGKAEMLLLVNGSGVNMADLRLYADEVDDCGCDGNPVAKPSDLEKLTAPVEHKELDKESAYMGKPKRKIDKWAVGGFFLFAAIVGIAVWFKTKDKKKTIVAACIGAVVGLIIGYFIGKRGETKQQTVDIIEDIEKEAEAETPPTPVTNPQESDKAEKKEFLQLGQSYDFVLPNAVFAMIYSGGTFYVAKDKNGSRIALKVGDIMKGKLIEVQEPQFFIPDAKTKKVIKIKSRKPLPFLDLGKKLYIPLSVVDPMSIVTTQEAMDYLDGVRDLNQEIYVKGRYAGKKVFNLMYMPHYDSAIRQKFGVRSR